MVEASIHSPKLDLVSVGVAKECGPGGMSIGRRAEDAA
jgi:hypothetical protein